MSNHQRQILEIMETQGVVSNLGFFNGLGTSKSINEFFINLKARIEESICFDFGNIESFSGVKGIPRLFKLPYSRTWIEFSATDKKTNAKVSCYVLLSNLEIDFDFIGADIFVDVTGIGLRFFTYLFLQNENDQIKVEAIGSYTDDESKFIHEIVNNVIAMITVMNCKNIKKVEHRVSEKLQKCRSKRGKKPLFSYWTLEVDLTKTGRHGNSPAGTHRSPRFHLRRGHFRHYQNGDVIWIDETSVGSGPGMVHKDYRPTL